MGSFSSSPNELQQIGKEIGIENGNYKEIHNLYAQRNELEPTHTIKSENAIFSIISNKKNNMNTPTPRESQFFTFAEIGQICYIGYGIKLNSTELLDDIWSFDADKCEWKKIILTGDKIISRYGSSATVVGKYLYIYGGFNYDSKYLSELHRVNIYTGKVEHIKTIGESPKEGISPILGNFDNHLIVFGGYNGECKDMKKEMLYDLDLETLIWTIYETNFSNLRTDASYTESDRYLISYSLNGSQSITIIDKKTKKVYTEYFKSQLTPASNLFKPGIVIVDNQYLYLFGGRGQAKWSHLYQFDIFERTWKYIRIEIVEKIKNNNNVLFHKELNGDYLIPSFDSFCVIFRNKTREIISFLGQPLGVFEMFSLKLPDINDDVDYKNLENENDIKYLFSEIKE